jgi:O-antigen/teichoic acid export membrane protein
LFKTLVAIGIFQAVTVAVNIVRSKTLSVALGPEGLGLIGTIDQLLNALVQLCSLSLPAVALRLLPRVHGDIGAFRRQYASFIKAVVLVSAGGIAVAAAMVQIRPDILGAELAPHRATIDVALLSVPVLALGLLLPNVLAASQRPTGAAALFFAVAAAAAVAAGIGLRLGSILHIYLVQFALTGVLIAVTLAYFKQHLGLPFYDPHGGLRAALKANPDIGASAGAVYVSVLGSSVALLAVRSATLSSLGAEPVGFLQATLSMVLAVGGVLAAMNGRYLGPVLNRRGQTTNRAVVVELFRKRQLMLLTVMAIPLVLFAEVVVALLFSREFTPAAAWLPAFLVWQLLVLQGGIQQQLLFALDELQPLMLIAIAGHGLATLLCFVLIPRYGLSGAAAAMLSGTVLMNVLGAQRLQRRHGIHPNRTSLLLIAYVVTALLGAPYVLRAFGDASGIAVRLLLCAVLIAGLWLFLGADDKAGLKALARPRAR